MRGRTGNFGWKLWVHTAQPASMVRSWMARSVYWERGWMTSSSAVDSWSSQQWQHLASLGSSASNSTTPNPVNSLIRKWLRFPSIPEAWTRSMALFWAAAEICHSLPQRLNKASWQGCTTGTLWLLSRPLTSWICVASHPCLALYRGSHIPTYLSYTPSPLSITLTSSPHPSLSWHFSCMFHVSPTSCTLRPSHWLNTSIAFPYTWYPFFKWVTLLGLLGPWRWRHFTSLNAGNCLHMYRVSHPSCGVSISYLDLTTDFSLPQPTAEDDFQCPSEDKTEPVIQCNNYRHTREGEGSCK